MNSSPAIKRGSPCDPYETVSADFQKKFGNRRSAEHTANAHRCSTGRIPSIVVFHNAVGLVAEIPMLFVKKARIRCLDDIKLALLSDISLALSERQLEWLPVATHFGKPYEGRLA